MANVRISWNNNSARSPIRKDTVPHPAFSMAPIKFHDLTPLYQVDFYPFIDINGPKSKCRELIIIFMSSG